MISVQSNKYLCSAVLNCTNPFLYGFEIGGEFPRNKRLCGFSITTLFLQIKKMYGNLKNVFLQMFLVFRSLLDNNTLHCGFMTEKLRERQYHNYHLQMFGNIVAWKFPVNKGNLFRLFLLIYFMCPVNNQ